MVETVVRSSTGLIQYDGLEAYLRKINSFPMLSAEEEHDLAERLQKTGDKEAAYKLVMSHLRFVVHVARGYMGYGLPLKDLIQEGTVGLMKAVSRFDLSCGVRLATYAVHWIKSEIHEFVIRNFRMLKVATTKAQRKLFFNLKKYKKNTVWLSPSDIEKVANELDVTPREVLEMESRMASMDMPYDCSDSDDDNNMSPALYLEDKSSNFSAIMENANWQENACDALRDALDQLDERTRYIIQRRWLDVEKATLQDLARQLGVSAERVRQLESQALARIKEIMTSAE